MREHTNRGVADVLLFRARDRLNGRLMTYTWISGVKLRGTLVGPSRAGASAVASLVAPSIMWEVILSSYSYSYLGTGYSVDLH